MKPPSRLLGTRSAVALAVVLFGAATSPAAILDVPGVFPTIQDAIRAAVDGDIVRVAPGTYPESIDFLGKAIRVESTDGPALTIIDAQRIDRVLIAVSFEGNDSVLEGFTLTGGRSLQEGGAVLLSGSAPTFRNCVFEGNESEAGGGAVMAIDAPGVRFIDCAIRDNTASSPGPVGSDGAGVWLAESSRAEFLRCVFFQNFADGEGGAIRASEASEVSVIQSTFLQNIAVGAGGALRLSGDSRLIARASTFRENSGSAGGALRASGDTVANAESCEFFANDAADGSAIRGSGGLRLTLRRCSIVEHGFPALELSQSRRARIRNSILWSNGGSGGIRASRVPVVEYSDVEGGFAGSGNVNVDPLFVNQAAGDLRLTAASPLIDAGDPSLRRLAARDVNDDPRLLDGDLDGSLVVDMGSDEFNAIHLEVTGSFTPGGAIQIDTTGTPGLNAVLFAGLGEDEVFLGGFGTLFVDLAAPFVLVPWPSTPSSVNAVLPANTPPDTLIVLQEAAFGAGAGTLSNVVSFVVR